MAAYSTSDAAVLDADTWWMLVAGEEVGRPAPDESAFRLFSWIGTPKSRFVRITPDEISGRGFHVAQRRPSTDTA